MQLHGIAQPVTVVALATASLQTKWVIEAEHLMGVKGLSYRFRASIALTFYYTIFDFQTI